jgi:hypothetical protein
MQQQLSFVCRSLFGSNEIWKWKMEHDSGLLALSVALPICQVHSFGKSPWRLIGANSWGRFFKTWIGFFVIAALITLIVVMSKTVHV